MKKENKRLLITSAILFVSLLLIEMFVSNIPLIQSSVLGLEENRLDLESAETTGSITYFKSDKFSVRGKSTAVFSDVGSEMHWVRIDTTYHSNIITLNVYKTDKLSEYRFVNCGSFRLMPGTSEWLYIKSDGELNQLKFEFNSDCKILFVEGITLNGAKPFSFNFVRFALLLVIAFITAATVIKKWYLIPFDFKKTSHTELLIAATLLCLSFVGISTVKNFGFDKYPLQENIGTYDCYTQLFDGFMKGQLNIDLPFDPSDLESLDNPYDRSERDEKLGSNTHVLFDRVFYNGKYYVYFGAAPVLTVYYPIYLLSGGYIPRDGVTSMIFAIAATVTVLLALCSMMKHYGLKPPFWLVFTGGVTLCTGSMIYLLNSLPAMYYIAILSGITFLALAIFLIYTAADTESAVKRRVCLAFSAVSIVLVAASRPSHALYALMTLPLLCGMFFSKKRDSSDRVKNLLSFAPLLIAGACGIMWYNYARFGNPLVFGNDYQLTLVDMSYMDVEPFLLMPAIFHFFIQPPAYTGSFPYVDINYVNLGVYRGYMYVYGSVGAFSFPATLGVFGVPFIKKDKAKTFAYVLPAALTVFVALLDMSMGGTHIRYLCDIMFPLMLIGTLVLFEFAQYGMEKGGKFARNSYFLITAVFAVTFLISFGLIFANEADNIYKLSPKVFAFFNNIFKLY